MHALLHTLGVIAVLPYLALALLFLTIREAAQAPGLSALLDTVANRAEGFFRWGLYTVALLWVGLWVMGFFAPLQRAGALCLGLLALASLAVIVALHSARLGPGQIVFLLPCVAVAAGSAWLFVRAGQG